MCLSVLEAQQQQQQASSDGNSINSPALQDELMTSHVLQAITNASEYGPCNVELQRSPQLQVVRDLAAVEGKPLVTAAAAQALRMAGVK